MMKELKKFSLTLFVICVVASFLLSAIYRITKPKIEKQKQAEELESLKEVIPDAKSFNPIKKDDEVIYYQAKDAGGQTFAYAFKVYGKGYSSTVETMVGIMPGGKITNIKIISQNETPGLGNRIVEVEQKATLWDKIRSKKAEGAQRPWFQAQFSDRRLDEFDKIDAISGATVSSKAVIDSVEERSEEILKLIGKNER